MLHIIGDTWGYDLDESPGWNYICALETTLMNLGILNDEHFYVNDVEHLDKKYSRKDNG